MAMMKREVFSIWERNRNRKLQEYCEILRQMPVNLPPAPWTEWERIVVIYPDQVNITLEFSPLQGVFVKNIGCRIIAEFEIDLFFTWIGYSVQIAIANTIAKTIWPFSFTFSGNCGCELINLQKPFYQLIAGVNFKDTIRASPILDSSTKFVLAFLGTCTQDQDDCPYK